MLVIVITFNKVDGEIISGPDIISRGSSMFVIQKNFEGIK